jgi:hypothetical protein
MRPGRRQGSETESHLDLALVRASGVDIHAPSDDAPAPTTIEGFDARPTPPPQSFASIANRVLRPTRPRRGPTAKWPPSGAEPEDAGPPPSRRKILVEAWGRRSDDGGLSAIIRAVTTSLGGEDDDSS